MPEVIKKKWRPKLWHVVSLVLGMILSLPFAGLILFQLYADQLVQQTEESLIGQASVLAATYAELYQENGPTDFEGFTPAVEVSLEGYEGYAPIFPSLSFSRNTVLPPRPSAEGAVIPPEDIYLEIGRFLSNVSNAAQQQNLAGYRILDNNGNVVGGSAEVGTSLASVGEVSAALGGKFTSVVRSRIRETREPLIYGLSAGTRVRIFVAMPVVVEGHVVGAVYLSRTPNHIFRFFYAERFNLIKATLFVLIASGLIGFVFWRFITRPVHTLIKRTKYIEQNGKLGGEPLKHYGTREIENLSHSFEAMTASLQNRQDAINTYTSHVTHELKSPLTSIKGASELLKEADLEMGAEQRRKFLENIALDAARMEDLLQSMRAFAQADQPMPVGRCALDQLKDKFADRFSGLRIWVENGELTLPIHPKPLLIILNHLLENALEHGAENITLSVGQDQKAFLDICDDGSGISEGNRDKIMTPFFTTRRENGGTGMGLSIVKSMLETMGGRIELTGQASGAGFRIWLDEH